MWCLVMLLICRGSGRLRRTWPRMLIMRPQRMAVGLNLTMVASLCFLNPQAHIMIVTSSRKLYYTLTTGADPRYNYTTARAMHFKAATFIAQDKLQYMDLS